MTLAAFVTLVFILSCGAAVEDLPEVSPSASTGAAEGAKEAVAKRLRRNEPTATPSQLGEGIAPSEETTPLIALDGGDASPVVSVGDALFEVEIAFTPAHRIRGLSGRDELREGAGMLFVFESGRASSFWMNGMRFPLDFVWIGDDCAVVDIHADVPAPPPGAEGSALHVYSSERAARYNLEVNAGAAAALGIEIGDEVKFIGFSGEGATCR